MLRPQADELLDFALLQLITDTADPRSVIRGHSLARDMFGTDAGNNGFLTVNPAGGPMTIQAAGPVTITMQGQPTTSYYAIQTWLPAPSNFAANGQALFGFDFTRWLIRLTVPGSRIPRSPDQTLEILIDDFGQFGNLSGYSGLGYHTFYVSNLGVDATTGLNNPTQGIVNNQLVQPVPNVPFILDGRWLHAFNGPGMGTQNTAVTINNSNFANLTLNVPNSTYGNFRYNGLDPNAVGMDEDYDACDLENWFLAIQSADGQVIIPSFHRPGIVRYQDAAHLMDWDGTSGGFRYPNGTLGMPNLDSMGRILRPVAADGHDAATFPDLVPDPNTGKITYDVDNDGDGVKDSVWLDLGYPARLDANGNLYKPLFAFMVIGLNGRIPLNTAGNLAEDGATHAQNLGNSVSEIDPTYGLQNAFLFGQEADPFNVTSNGAPPLTSNTQVDNAGIDVRLTQLRNLLAGTRASEPPTAAAQHGREWRRQHRLRLVARRYGTGYRLLPAQRNRGRRRYPVPQPVEHPARSAHNAAGRRAMGRIGVRPGGAVQHSQRHPGRPDPGELRQPGPSRLLVRLHRSPQQPRLCQHSIPPRRSR